MVIGKAYRYRIDPTRAQAEQVDWPRVDYGPCLCYRHAS